MFDFAATATWRDKLPGWATETDGVRTFLTETPAWFLELPKDARRIRFAATVLLRVFRILEPLAVAIAEVHEVSRRCCSAKAGGLVSR
jgi:hypothetical protein